MVSDSMIVRGGGRIKGWVAQGAFLMEQLATKRDSNGREYLGFEAKDSIESRIFLLISS